MAIITEAEITIAINRAKAKIASLAYDSALKRKQGDLATEEHNVISYLSSCIRSLENENDFTSQEKNEIVNYMYGIGNLSEVAISTIESLEYVANRLDPNTFLGLTDTPNAYEINKIVRVNDSGTGLTFVDPDEIITVQHGSGTEDEILNNIDNFSGVAMSVINEPTTAKDNYIVRLSSAFKTWLSDIFDAIDTAIDLIIIDITSLEAFQDTFNGGATGTVLQKNSAVDGDFSWINIQTYLKKFTDKASFDAFTMTAVTAGGVASIATGLVTEAELEGANSAYIQKSAVDISLTVKTWDASIVGAGPYNYEIQFCGDIIALTGTASTAQIVFYNATTSAPIGGGAVILFSGTERRNFMMNFKTTLASGDVIKVKIIADDAENFFLSSGFFVGSILKIEANLLTDF
jgi:hypothetical protein